MLLSERIKITKVNDDSTASTVTVDSTSVDMAGYDGVLFVTSYGTAAADNLLEASESTAASSGFGALLGSEVGAAASDEDQWIDIGRPNDRYVRCSAVRATSTTISSIWAFQYGARDVPVDNTTAGTIHGEQHVSPSTGTA